MINKLKEFKEAVKNTPPERLARIEYRSHFLQACGITFVSIFLLMKGFWYIIFAFIFGLGISYSQGVTAYQKYHTILALIGKEKPEDFENDISLTRRRSKIIQSVFYPAKFLSIGLSVITTVLLIDPELPRLTLSFLYPMVILILYIGIYFIFFYSICYPIYKRRLNKQ